MFKNKLLKAIACAAVSVAMLSSVASAIEVKVNDKTINFDEEPIMINDRVMVPMRAIFESLGANVEWHEATQSITATRGSDVIEMAIGSTTMTVNGKTIKLDEGTAPILGEKRTLVPTRAIAEALGSTVSWNDATETVYIVDETGSANPNAFDKYVADWKLAYEEFINSKEGKFELIYLNNDDMPEIAIIPGNAVLNGVSIYYYSGGVLKPIVDESGSDSFGTYGKMSYKERSNMIAYDNGSMGIYKRCTANVVNNVAHVMEEYEFNTKSNTAKWNGAVKPYDALDKKFKELIKDYKTIDYSTGGTVIKDENVKKALDLYN